jgi:UDP-N-acetyl-D-mannosaminuronic acid dehydrogenase
MPAALNLKPEQIDSAENRSQFCVAVLGCGQKGILFAVTFAKAGFSVTCLDADASVIKKIAKGKIPFLDQETQSQLKRLITSGQLIVTIELKKTLSKSDIIIITVPAKVDEKKKTDYSETLNAFKLVGSALHLGSLVIVGEIVGFGFIEGAAKETLENTSGLKAGKDFGLVYMPLFKSGNKNVTPNANFELIVAAVGKTGLDAAIEIAKTLTSDVKLASEVKTAELATLFRIEKQDANTALANELAVFCEVTNSDYFEVRKILDLNDKEFLPTAVEQESMDNAYFLLENADNINAKLRLSTLSRQINEDMIKHGMNLTQEALRGCGKTLRRARVAVLGNVNSENSTGVYIKLLTLKGAKISLYDPASKGESLESNVVKSNLNEAVEGADCIVILSREQPFSSLNLKKIKPLTKAPSILVDLAGAYEPEKVKAEGFIYRGIGRGVE